MSTASQRRAWAPACTEQRMVPVVLHGGLRVRVDARCAAAFNALSAWFAHHRYEVDPDDPGGPGAFNCRPITGGNGYSLHAYGIAVDVNPSRNPYTKLRLITDMPTEMIADITRMRTRSGHQVFRWGGDWDTDADSGDQSVWDAMHFEIACTPAQLDTGIDSSTMPGKEPQMPEVDVSTTMPVVQKGARGTTVRVAQTALGMTGKRVDGGFGPDTDKTVRAFQTAAGLKPDGIIGAATWTALLGGLS